MRILAVRVFAVLAATLIPATLWSAPPAFAQTVGVEATGAQTTGAQTTGTEATGAETTGTQTTGAGTAGAETPAPAPWPVGTTHRYAPVADAAPSAAAQALADRLGAKAEVVELFAQGEARALARVEAASAPDGARRLLSWRSLTPAPVLRRDIRADEELRLIEALDKHLPKGARILAFPGVSRRLVALSAADASPDAPSDAPFDAPLAEEAEPLVMPGPWTRDGAEVAAFETALWDAPAREGVAGAGLEAFVDALLAEDVNGAARLRVLAGVGEAYVLVHISDAFQLGRLRPGRMEMTRRDFSATGFSHDLAREARQWAQKNDQAAWAVERAADGGLRGYYLTDAAETATLIAQLLPFNTSRIDAVPGLRLVWQWEGYWLYRLAPVAPVAPTAPVAPVAPSDAQAPPGDEPDQ